MNRGFTLIELLVAVLIIALLGSVVFSTTGVSKQKARPLYQRGDLVISVVDEKQGQITKIICNTKTCHYHINFWTEEGFDESSMEAFEFKSDDGF